MEQSFTINGKSYQVLELLGHGKGGYSYLVERDGLQFVLKQIHHEPCDYYSFGDKLAAERHDYARLSAIGMPMPKLLEVDEKQERILKEYICGHTVKELCDQGLLEEAHLRQGAQMAELARSAGLNIDYYPTNFVLQDGSLYYIDYECNPYAEEWSFAVWGRQYWKNREE